MQIATISQFKKELKSFTKEELTEVVLTLAKYKKDNKELLSYHLFEKYDETSYINNVKIEVDILFETINVTRYFSTNKSVRKILRLVKKYAKFSKNKETEIELLLYFCKKISDLNISSNINTILVNIYERQMTLINKNISKMHPDLQHDYLLELEALTLRQKVTNLSSTQV